MYHVYNNGGTWHVTMILDTSSDSLGPVGAIDLSVDWAVVVAKSVYPE